MRKSPAAHRDLRLGANRHAGHPYPTGRAAIEAALDAIVIIDAHGCVIEWNPAATEVFGYARPDVLGVELAELIIPPEQRTEHKRGLARYLATGEGPVLDTRLKVEGVDSRGERITVELTISALGTGDQPLFIGWMRDVTELERAREAVDRSERRLASMLANISDIITVVDPEGRWVASSGAGMAGLGWPDGFDTEGGFYGLLHPDDVWRVRGLVDDLRSKRTLASERFDLRIRTSARSYHVLETVAENLIDDPAVEAVVLSSRDVTQERLGAAQLRETSSRLEALMGSLSDGVLFVDENHRITFTNTAFCDLFGYPTKPSQLVGLPTSDVRPHASAAAIDKAAFLAGIADAYEANESRFAEEVELRGGRVLERDYIPVTVDSEPVGHLWLYRDITERKVAERARERLVGEEKKARAEAEQQNESLRELAQLKSELLAMVSHELRTPLTSIVTFVDLLGSEIDDGWPSENREFVEIIARNAGRLQRLVDDLLLLGQLESGVLQVSSSLFPAARIFDTTITELRPQAQAKGVSLVVDVAEGPPINGDEGRLLQVLENLVSNAIKFSPIGGEVVMSARREDSSWLVCVADEGPGVPDDSAERLFEKFFRAPAPAPQETSGTGLGLAISKAIVELHNGEIWLATSPGAGATFEFTVPDVVARR